MRATILDLRRRIPEVLRALDRHERVTILYRGKERAVLIPFGDQPLKKIGATLVLMPRSECGPIATTTLT